MQQTFRKLLLDLLSSDAKNNVTIMLNVILKIVYTYDNVCKVKKSPGLVIWDYKQRVVSLCDILLRLPCDSLQENFLNNFIGFDFKEFWKFMRLLLEVLMLFF